MLLIRNKDGKIPSKLIWKAGIMKNLIAWFEDRIKK